MAKEKSKKRITINPEEAEVIRLIYQWYLTDMGARAIAERLNKEGHSYRGKPWCKNRVLDIIGEEAYAGRYYFNRRDHKTHKPKPKKEWILIPVEPIVDEGTWTRAKELKELRAPSETRANPAVTGSKTILTGLAYCGRCNARMSLETAKGGRFVYYNCANFLRRGKSACQGQRVPAQELEQAVLDHMATKLFTKERVREILKGIYQEIHDKDEQRDVQRKNLLRQLELTKGKLARQYEAIESGIITLQDVAERIRELKDQRAQLEQKLAELRVSRVIPLHLFKDEAIENFQGTLRGLFLNGNRPLTKQYLKLFIEKITVEMPRVSIMVSSKALLATLENGTAARTDDVVLTADEFWLPGADSNHGPDG